MLSLISNCYCHSRNELPVEFFDLNLIIFCDTDRQTHTYIQTLWLLESPDLLDCETENGQNLLNSFISDKTQMKYSMGNQAWNSSWQCQLSMINFSIDKIIWSHSPWILMILEIITCQVLTSYDGCLYDVIWTQCP